MGALELKARDAVALAAHLASYGPDVLEALDLAAFVHDGQFRKENRAGVKYRDPYIAHPIRNALRAARFTHGLMSRADVVNLIVASLLHDTVEDAPERITTFYDMHEIVGTDRDVALAQISARFGRAVADTVRKVTNPKHFAELPRQERNAAYLSHLQNVVVVHEGAYLTKAMDLIDNAGSLKHMATCDKQKNLAEKYMDPVHAMINHSETVAHTVVRDRVITRLTQVLAELETINTPPEFKI